MKTKIATLIIFCITIISTTLLNAQVREIPLEDFFRNPEKSGYQISPNGKFYSYLAPYEKRMNIFVQKIGKEKAEQLTFETDRDIAGYFWGNDGRILYLKDDEIICLRSRVIQFFLIVVRHQLDT